MNQPTNPIACAITGGTYDLYFAAALAGLLASGKEVDGVVAGAQSIAIAMVKHRTVLANEVGL